MAIGENYFATSTAKKVDKVTKADIRRVSNQVFADSNRTVGTIQMQIASNGQVKATAKERNSNERCPGPHSLLSS